MAHEIQIDPAIRGESGFRHVRKAVGMLADQQQGVGSREQLLELGMSSTGIERGLANGELHPKYRGIYAIGRPRLSEFGEWMAAVLAGGSGAVLSHISAARLWRLTTISERRRIHVVTKDGREHRRIRFHRCELSDGDVSRRHGIPVTTPRRTLIDFASLASQAQLEKAVREALYQHLVTTASLTSCCSTLGNRRGAAKLRKAIAKATQTDGRTRSELEDAFLAFLDTHKLPPPDAVNVQMQIGDLPIEADCLWRDARLIVELDSRGAHDNAHAFEADRKRDRKLQAAGWRVIRITWRQLHAEPTATAADLALLTEAFPTPLAA